jgi:hypothetical protein
MMSGREPQLTMVPMPWWRLASSGEESCIQEVIVDEQRFDAIARALGTPSRRRGVVKAAAGGVLGLVGFSIRANDGLALRCDSDQDCRNNGKRDQCDHHRCVECTGNPDCKRNRECVNNRCKRR